MTGPGPASLAVVHVWPHRCLVRYPLTRGEVRRRGHPSNPRRLFALDLSCPACGCRNTWLDGFGDPPILEGPMVRVVPQVDDEEDRQEDKCLEPWEHPTSYDSTRVRPCAGCQRELTIRGGLLSAA